MDEEKRISLEEKEDCKEDSKDGEDDRGSRVVDVSASTDCRVVDDVLCTSRESDSSVIKGDSATKTKDLTDDSLDETRNAILIRNLRLSDDLDINTDRVGISSDLATEGNIRGKVIGDVVERDHRINNGLSFTMDRSTDKDELEVVVLVLILVVADLIDNLEGVGRDRGLGELEITGNVRRDDVLGDSCL